MRHGRLGLGASVVALIVSACSSSNDSNAAAPASDAQTQASEPVQAGAAAQSGGATMLSDEPASAGTNAASSPDAAEVMAAAAGSSAAGGATAAAGATAPDAPMDGGVAAVDSGAAPGSSASDAADPSPGCSEGALMPGESMQMLESGGQSRVFVQHIPDSYDGKTPMPVVLDLHGGSYDGPRWVDVSGFKALGDSEGFITLFPSGTDNSWLAESPDSADGQFLKDLIAAIGKQGCIDRKRIYATGCSMGGAMSFWMGCFASDLVAAIAPMCGTPFFELMECKPQRPIAMMLTIGETDNLNCWEGARQGIGNPCAMDVFAYFDDMDMCSGEAQDTHDGVCKTYDQCAQGTEVSVCKSNTGHGVYTATNIEVTNESWKFLKRFALP